MRRRDFWSRFYRKFHWAICWHEGIDFNYKGDQVTWLWPWKRNNYDKPYLSTSFMCTFKSLKEMDEMWDGYIKAISK